MATWVGSKAYDSSGSYIDQMSDFCKSGAHDVKAKAGIRARPFNLVHLSFRNRYGARFEGTPRKAQMYRTWDRMVEGRPQAVLGWAEAFLARKSAGDTV